jgi:hypothetical protein
VDRFPGRYLGIVQDNQDPKGLCRLRATVPEVLGDQVTGWCLPSTPYAGAKVGWAAVPPEKSRVFVEWPAGDLTRVPIWSGAGWADGEGVDGAGPELVVLLTPGGNRVELRDVGGKEAVELTAASGARVVLDKAGITVEFGSQRIAMTRDAISFNGDALEVR